jgi:hypothetical protein
MESYYELMQCFLQNFYEEITHILINEMFDSMHILTIIITSTFLAKLEV